MVPEERRAWHAGRSYWRGHTSVNDDSIGIELVNPGHTTATSLSRRADRGADPAASPDIMQRHNITRGNVVGHSDVAPARKRDPGELFPWAQLATAAAGAAAADPQPDRPELDRRRLPARAGAVRLRRQRPDGRDHRLPAPLPPRADRRHDRRRMPRASCSLCCCPSRRAMTDWLIPSAAPIWARPEGRAAAARASAGEESPGSTERRCRLMAGGGDPRESATESRPPRLRPGKGERVG